MEQQHQQKLHQQLLKLQQQPEPLLKLQWPLHLKLHQQQPKVNQQLQNKKALSQTTKQPSSKTTSRPPSPATPTTTTTKAMKNEKF